MPLRITAEYEHWRRVEDSEGVGGWVNFVLLSGVRTALVTQDMAEFHTLPDAAAPVSFQAELGVVGRILRCEPDWCRISADGQPGLGSEDRALGRRSGRDHRVALRDGRTCSEGRGWARRKSLQPGASPWHFPHRPA